MEVPQSNYTNCRYDESLVILKGQSMAFVLYPLATIYALYTCNQIIQTKPASKECCGFLIAQEGKETFCKMCNNRFTYFFMHDFNNKR